MEENLYNLPYISNQVYNHNQSIFFLSITYSPFASLSVSNFITVCFNVVFHFLSKNGGQKIAKIISESQIYMAQKTAQLHKDLCAAASEGGIESEVWLVGYAELKGKWLFLEYRDELKKSYGETQAWEKVFVFQHFSMNGFSIDLNNFMKNHADFTILEAAHELGWIHKKEIFA